MESPRWASPSSVPLRACPLPVPCAWHRAGQSLGGVVRGISTLEQFQGKGLAHSAESEGVHGEQKGNPAEMVSSSWG